ncbi:MAG TPA: lysophospholipid acyltransferase family protein [Candidatus Polarisedimenticolaceae bacterium]|nr:lysophospholipid acyltransferase family protein [Candidatus Polarisedimenticolaceae bacterium]
MKRLLSTALMLAFHVGFARPVLQWFVGVRYRRRDRVPRGPCVVVSNHNSHLDAAVLMSLFPLGRLPHVHPVAAADYFGSSWIRRTAAMVLMNGIPIERRPRAGGDPLQPMADALAQGESLVFFPEGSRGEAGVVAPFRPGIGRLVQKMPGLLVVPVFLSGPERIWPRGQVVPVPLSIDAFVGRPRSYSPELDAKEIADQLQRDVLALAPPAPPLPQPHPGPPLRVAVTGLDPGSRHEVFDQVTRRLGQTEKTLGITDPVIEVDPDGVRELTGPIPQPRGRPWLGALAKIFRTGGLFKGQKFVEMVDLAQIDEALGHRPATRVVVTDGSALVDLLAWAKAVYYPGTVDDNEMNHLLQYLAGRKPIPAAKWPSFIRRAPEVWLVNTFDLAHPPVPDVLVHVRQPVERIMQLLRSRGERLAAHENEAFLERLDQSYGQIAKVLERRHKVDFIEVELEARGDGEWLGVVQQVCRRRLEDRDTARRGDPDGNVPVVQ